MELGKTEKASMIGYAIFLVVVVIIFFITITHE